MNTRTKERVNCYPLFFLCKYAKTKTSILRFRHTFARESLADCAAMLLRAKSYWDTALWIPYFVKNNIREKQICFSRMF
jgi:hypothetical protein